ncbi:MAG: hypothetical protein KDD82_01350 [Planctomycetes bacterium]|nr:hypothetical protein [Planctomycetota bacterium]
MKLRWILLALACSCAPVAWGDGRGLRDGLAAAEAAFTAGDESALDRALVAVLAEDGAKAAKGLLELVERRAEPPQAYWQVVYALGALEDSRAIDQLERWLSKHDEAPLAVDLVSAWDGNGSKDLEPALIGLLHQRKLGLGVRLLLVDRLSERATASAVDALFELWADRKQPAALQARVKDGLVGLLGDDMGALDNFKSFWEQHRGERLPLGAEESTGTAVDGIDPTRRAGLQTLTRKGGRVIVLRGQNTNFDQVEGILARMKIKHEVLQKKAFMADLEGALRGTAVVLLNCNAYGDFCVCKSCKPVQGPRGYVCGGCDVHTYEGNDGLTPAAQERLRTFVARGGSVFSEDWGMWELTQPTWPKLVAPGETLDEQEVDYYLPPGSAGDPLLRGVIRRDGPTLTFKDRRWTVDAASPAIQVLDGTKVRVLLASRALQARNPEQHALAVVLEPGGAATGGAGRPRTGEGPEPEGGMVLHVLSHFGKQSRKADEFALQNLLINFVLEAQARFARRR